MMLGEDLIINQQKQVAEQIAKGFKIPTNSIVKGNYITIKGKTVKINKDSK